MSSNVRERATNAVSTFSPDATEWDDPIQWNPLDFEYEVPEYGGDLDLKELEELGQDVIDLLPDSMPSDPFISSKVFGEEVGDDRLDFSRAPIRLAAALVLQEKAMGMKTSKEDTYISRWVWNFCEVSNPIPTDVTQSYHFCRKSGTFENLGFTDVPPLRIILDVMKGDRSHSSTAPGKVAMLGSRMRTPNTQHLPSLQLASYMQDGLLRTSMSSEPKYLPQIMGGSGARALFNNPKNLYLSVYAYRGSTCQRIYGTACRELQSCLSYLERGRATMPVLCQRLRDKQEYLHATYDEKVLLAPSSLRDEVNDHLPSPILLATGGANRFSCFENRLVRTKALVTRTIAERQHAYYTRVRRQILSGSTLDQTESVIGLEKARARSKYGNALTANTAFANLLARKASPKDVRALLDEGFIPVNTGVTHFTWWDAQFLFNGGRSETYSIEDLSFCEDMFVRTEVSDEETYKIGNLRLAPLIGNKPKLVVTKTKVGLYEINQSMEDWSDTIMTELQSRRELGHPVSRETALQVFEKYPEWVNDDSLLIQRCLRDSADRNYRTSRVLLISSDRRLANQMAQTCNVTVMRVDPIDYIKLMESTDLEFLSKTENLQLATIEMNHRGRGDGIAFQYLDSGSVMAAASKLDMQPLDDRPQFVRREVREAGYQKSGSRFSSYVLTPLKQKAKLVDEIHRPVVLPKRFRYGNFPENRQPRTPSGSWRSGSVSSKSEQCQ